MRSPLTHACTTAAPRPGVSCNRFEHVPNRGETVELLRQLQATAAFRPRPVARNPVVLYGAGELGQLARAWCESHGVTVHAVVDAGAPRWKEHPAWQGLPLLLPQDVPCEWWTRHRLLVCISTLAYSPLESTLLDQGWHDVQPFYDFAARWPIPHPLNNGWHALLPAPRDDAALRGVLDRWDDDVSRAHHLQFLAWRCRRNEWMFDGAPVQTDQRYVIPEWMAGWRDAEQVLDGGAHHGQVLARWWSLRPEGIERAWAVEPDPDNRNELNRWRDSLPPERFQRIEVCADALGRRRGRLSFIDGQGYGSRLWAHGTRSIVVRAIDDLGWRPTVIKLHLEGHELAALRGGARTLAQTRPLLALTVYHHRDGLSATAHWLMHTLPDYRWMFRLHGWQGTAAVVYGVPLERVSQ